jgi:hypothetical protein
MEQLLRALADGRLVDVVAGLDAFRPTDPLVAEVIAADAAGRTGTMGLPELQDLLDRADRPLLRWWVLAILGERAFLDTDLGGIPLAAQVLHELPEDPYATLPLLYVRGRLRRIASALYLITPSAESIADHRRLRDAAVADFVRAGFTAEVALTRGLSAALHALATWEDVLEDMEVVRDARALLGDLEGSVWAPVLDHLLAQVALTAGEFSIADAALAAVERQSGLHPVFTALADVTRAELDLVASDGSAAAAASVQAALDRIRTTRPQLLPLSQLHAANLLADYGHLGAARTVGLAGIEWPPTNRMIALTGALLRIRLDVLSGGPVDAATTLELLERLERLGHVRRAGIFAVRMARDFATADDHAAAETLRTWGLARLPDRRRRTVWEQTWSEPLTGVPASAPSTAIAVRVLVPVMEVEVGGSPVRLRDMAAKLLLLLLLTHPEPLHVERAVDVLWPDASAEEGRPRLNTVVHRLRNQLQLADDGLRRVGDLLLLAPDAWDVDLLRLRARPSDVATLLAITGNLCHLQFPYDDFLIEERRAVATEAARAIEATARTADRATSDELQRVTLKLMS